MSFDLVRRLDLNLLALVRWKEMVQSAANKEEKRQNDEEEKAAKALLDAIEEGFIDAFANIVACLCITIGYAAIAKLLDLLLGPLQWKHVIVFYAVQVAFAAVTKRSPAEPVVMIAILSIMPRVISGSLTRLLGTLYCVETIGWPLVVHTWENISDRTEVRWVLLGLLLDLVYLVTATFISSAKDFGLKSIGLIVSVFVGGGVISYLGGVVVLIDGPRNQYLGRISPLSQSLKSFSRFATQLLLFLLNRFSRFLFTALFTTSLPRGPAYLRDMLYNVNSPNITAHARCTREYVYQELQGEGTIRLLLVRKGWPSQKLECEFKVTQLGSSDTYEAVSYFWGDPSATHSIIVDDQHMLITKSAYDIIHRRRSALVNQLIWIDRICIDQTDTKEKASQVEMMGQIYKEAGRVTACLGDSKNAHLVQLLFAVLHFMKEGLRIPSEVMTALSTIKFQRPMWDALVEFFSNPWFRRVWIVQEVAFAQQLHLMYGNICMDWEYVSRAVEMLLDRHLYMAIRPSVKNISTFTASVRDALTGLRNADTMLEFHGEVNYKRKRDLALVLKECTSFASTDPRDKVFALLGLTTDDSKNLIKPNYDKDHVVQQVFTDAMRLILEKGDSPINYLEGAGIGTERSTRDLPSWVPDWSLTTPYPMDARYYTSGTRYNAKINLDLRKTSMISLDGLQFDRIKICGSVFSIDNNLSMTEDASATAKWLAEAEALATVYIGDTYRNGEQLSEAFIRTMLGNCATDELDKRPSTEQCHGDYQALKRFFTAAARMSIVEPSLDSTIPNYFMPSGFLDQPRETMEGANRFFHFFKAETKRFCITEQGRMAIIPPQSLPGDVICIFKGARAPFVLRQVCSEETSTYNLVGCCYVHGVMDGEIDIYESETFVLG